MPSRGSIGAQLPADIVLTPSDGSGDVKLMLADNEQAKKAWQMAEVPAPEGVRVTNQGASLQDSPPEMAATVFRVDNFGGMGSFLIVNNDETYMSGDVQTSVSGKIIQPPYVEEISIPGTTEGVTAIVAYQGSIYVANGSKVYRSDDGLDFYETLDTGGQVHQLITFGADDSDPGIIACVSTDGTTPDEYWFSLTGSPTAWDQVNSGGNRAISRMVNHQGQLWGLINPYTVVVTTDPFELDATWASSTTVGDTLTNFQGGVGVANFLVLFKEDAVWAISAGGIVTKLISQFENLPSTENFEAFSPGFNANIYMTVDQEIWEYDPASGSVRPLEVSKLPDTQIDGTAAVRQGLAYDEEGLYSIHQTNLLETQGPSILRSNFFPNGAAAHERWLVETPSGYRPEGPLYFTRAFETLGTGRHLFFGLNDPTGEDTTLKIGRMTIPRAADPTQDTASQYSVSDNIYRSGWMHHNFPAQYKDYTEVLLDLKGTSPIPPSSSVSAYYYLDGDMSTRYTLKEDITGDQLHHIEFENGVTARQFMLELILHGDSINVTPQVLAWNVKASVKFDFREVFTLAVRVGDRIRMRNNAVSAHTAKELRQRIRQLRAAKNITIRYQDFYGYDFDNVRILTGIIEVPLIDDKERTEETIMTLRVLRVSEPFLHPFIVDGVVGVNDVPNPSTVGGADVVGV